MLEAAPLTLHKLQAASTHLPRKSILRGVLTGLEALEAFRILHRDIKPANILMTVSDEGGLFSMRPTLCDFGLAAHLPAKDTFLQGRSCVTTYQYAAPEVLRAHHYSFASDCWAVGCSISEDGANGPLMDIPPPQDDLPRAAWLDAAASQAAGALRRFTFAWCAK